MVSRKSRRNRKMSETKIKKVVSGVEVEARFSPGAIMFFCGNRQGVAKWSVTRGEWLKVHNEIGWRFKAALKEAFSL
jgi:hypothetical protein